MVLDTSAIVAIHLKEPGFDQLIEKIDRAGIVAVGVPTLLESGIVLSARLGQDARVLLQGTLWRMSAQIIRNSSGGYRVGDRRRGAGVRRR